MGDLLAETAAGRPFGLGVLRMEVAGEGGEVEDVALLDAPPAGNEAIADDESTEGASEEFEPVRAGLARARLNRVGAAHAALSRKRFRIARRNSRAAWRWPSAEGWKPSSA